MNLLKLIPLSLKIWLIKHLYKDIAAEGRMGDTQLAHINDYEAGLLKSVGGSGTINPSTGLVEFGGGKGGGSAPSPDTKSYTSDLPEYAQPFYEELMKQTGKQVYKTDSSGNVTGVQEFTPYGGERLAPFTDQQTAIQTDVSGLTQPGRFATAGTGLDASMATAGTAASGITGALGYTPGSITEESITTEKFTDPGVAASYMNPYQQQVTDQGRNLQMQQANQAADLQAQQLGQQSQQFGAGLQKDVGLAGLGAGLQGAQAQAQLGATEQMANLERLKAQAASAGEQQAMQQEIDNLAYQESREAEDYQRKLLEYQSNILRGTAGALGSTQTQYAPAPSLASQIGGMGLAGLGLYNMLGK